MPPITPPEAGQPVEALWRVVAELVKKVNAIENMRVNGSKRTQKITVGGNSVAVPAPPQTGHLLVNEDSSVLTLI